MGDSAPLADCTGLGTPPSPATARAGWALFNENTTGEGRGAVAHIGLLSVPCRTWVGGVMKGFVVFN
jgi:hypothetical protein